MQGRGAPGQVQHGPALQLERDDGALLFRGADDLERIDFAQPLMRQLGWPTLFCHATPRDDEEVVLVSEDGAYR